MPNRLPSLADGEVTPTRPTRVALVATLVAVLAGAFAGLVGAIPGTVLLAAVPLVTAVSAGALFLVASTVEEVAEPSWRMWAFAVGLLGLGQGLTVVGGVVLDTGPMLGLVDWVRLPFVLLVAGGFALYPVLAGHGEARARAMMDALIGAIAYLALTWGLEVSIGRPAVFPIFDALVVATSLYVFLLGSRFLSDRRLWLFLAGCWLMVLADTMAVVSPATGSSQAVAALWLVGPLCWLLAAVAGSAAALRSVAAARASSWRLAAPYGLVGLAAVVMIVRWRSEALGSLPLGATLVALILVARQLVAGREVRRLVELERDRIIAALSQQVRGPLTAVEGFAGVLDDGWDRLPEDERHDMVRIIRDQSSQISGLVEDLAAVARDEVARVSLDLRRIDAKRLIADALRQEFDVDRGPLPVKAEVAPFMEVVGDRRRLVQILAQLLANARRYGGGKILVVAKRGKGRRIFEVHDDGPGVEPRYEEAIFHRFERGSHRFDSTIPGSGLGLAMARSLAEAHEGVLTCGTSDRLGGACFRLVLPHDVELIVERDEETV